MLCIRWAGVTLALLIACVWAWPQNVNTNIRPERLPPSADSTGRESNIRVDTQVVLIPVTVKDPLNRSVTGLESEHFKIVEEGTEQAITYFASEDAPLSVGLVFDASGSMSNKLQKSREAAAQFFKTAGPEDEFFLIQFNDRPVLAQAFTNEPGEIQNRLTFSQAKGRTALLDAIYLALNEMKKAKNPRKALLVISDGADNSSRYTTSEIRNLVREADVQIYTIGIFDAYSSTPEEMRGPGLLREISDQTGGRPFIITSVNELPDVSAKIGIELRNQYVLGYTPSNSMRDGKYRKVKVELVQPRGLPRLKAYWRPGYYAPTQ
ncbi:MAG: VWA domain-containing protein [Bryobacterales bacterium]|nr:VWA domain-containing protein [Bryobacterales bacterium]